MAGRRLEHLIVLSRAGGLAVAVAALAVLAVAHPRFTANNMVFSALIYGDMGWGAYLLWFQVRWLCLGGEQPGNAHLLVLIAGEWMFACITVGTACAAVTVDQFALQHRYCTARAACVLYLVAAAMACAAGALAAVSALGMLWILGSRYRLAQAP